ncbi:hypothetical protein GobsT_66330 [Gemmata obscuriglobus]|uniref:DUF1349 domain-containing protein n=1 Tax=Gemmata obscuriglobus TaxID=114 RepID=A0A2Z3H254_9BACT|nr:hypothetical protein [Gemmata obscuriglobus]AWM35684.1 hypothetical protein C1280_00695 [Gemmata obscuriglobus]QEG31789.1 hypothetical protein GobsT_66330 [Gemmata obscuriglobus]VTS11134.1 Uncharacterized protein OS=Pedosphaera parvula (strain Ellin514) GN=Cflav_PD4008 PE=4 SV=1 [Gemmata obscuriglobus UQM 2246]
MKRWGPLASTSALAFLVTFVSAAAPVPKEDGDTRLRRLYGTPVDPDKDCTFELKRDALQITIPATRHVVEDASRMNAPYTWNEVKGDFTATVRVAFPIRVVTPPGDSQRAESRAGLLAMAGGEVVQVVRTEFTFPRPIPNPQQENFHFNHYTTNRSYGASAVDKDGPGDAGYVRLTRAGKAVASFWSRDGKTWHEIKSDHRVGWEETVRVGVVAENSYQAQFEVTIDQFRLTQPAK